MTRITPADIEAAIASEHYFTAQDGVRGAHGERGSDRGRPELRLLTFCVLVLRNGHRVVGTNYGPVDPALFNAEMAQDEARKDAVSQVWPLLGYELRTKLAAMPTGTVPAEADKTRCQADKTWCEAAIPWCEAAKASAVTAAASAETAAASVQEASASARNAIGNVQAAILREPLTLSGYADTSAPTSARKAAEPLPLKDSPLHWKPRVGNQVTVKGYIANGTDEHPGLITRVHGAGQGAFANVTAFPDLQSPKIFSSIPVYSSRAAADADIPGATRRRDGYAYLQAEQ